METCLCQKKLLAKISIAFLLDCLYFTIIVVFDVVTLSTLRGIVHILYLFDLMLQCLLNF